VWASVETNIGKIRNIVEGGVNSKQEVLLAEIDVTSQSDFMDGYL
jgi:hypothetical protein